MLMVRRMAAITVLCALTLAWGATARAEIKMAETKETVFTISPSVTTDVIILDNNLDLDSSNRMDRVQYLGLIYSLGFGIRAKDDGPELFLLLERYGPYDYDAPLLINNKLQTYLGKVDPYTNAEYLPAIGEFWVDTPLYTTPFRARAGLYNYAVGHGAAVGGNFDNYGATLYAERDDFQWRFYYCVPNFNAKSVGPRIKQEKEQLWAWEPTKANYFATDVIVNFKPWGTIQPYISILYDTSDNKRVDYFATPTDDDLLGTVGCSIDLNFFDKLSIGLEAARNFGRAKSSVEGFDGVTHQGYMLYADAEYTAEGISPHVGFIYASGNKLTTDMIDNGDTLYPSTKNNAFSVYSPLNCNLADSIYSDVELLPLIAMGNGNGLNYGIRRPDSFNDPAVIENLILVDAGFDLDITKKASLIFDWWYLSSAEKGIGVYNNVPKVISADLGHEFDFIFTYEVTEHITFLVYSGIFLPGAAYREERDDTAGSLFTPFVRGDGKADPAYQAEICLTVSY